MKTEFHETCEDNTCTFNRWDMLMQIILVNFKLYVIEKCQKKKSLFHSWQNPVIVRKIHPPPPKKKNLIISIPYLLQAQLALSLILLACYCYSTTMCRWNGNSGNTLEGDVSDVIASDQPTSLFSSRKATRMSP